MNESHYDIRVFDQIGDQIYTSPMHKSIYSALNCMATIPMSILKEWDDSSFTLEHVTRVELWHFEARQNAGSYHLLEKFDR